MSSRLGGDASIRVVLAQCDLGGIGVCDKAARFGLAVMKLWHWVIPSLRLSGTWQTVSIADVGSRRCDRTDRFASVAKQAHCSIGPASSIGPRQCQRQQEMDRELRLEGLGFGRHHGMLFDVVCYGRAIQWL
jgi:hypothetical protein